MNNIKVGQYYTHINHQGTVYLGCGDCVNRYKPNESFKNKRLVIVKSTSAEFIGSMAVFRSPKRASGFTSIEEFQKVSKP